MMCQVRLRRVVGIGAICFGAGILISLFLTGYFAALVEAAVLILVGICLLGKRC